jgi:serine/threonine-protein kinase SRPK3
LEKGDPGLVKMFDDAGRVREPIPVPLDRPALSSEDCMPGLSEEHRNRFDSFLRLMMSLNPDDRLTPEDLLRHPWLDALE